MVSSTLFCSKQRSRLRMTYTFDFFATVRHTPAIPIIPSPKQHIFGIIRHRYSSYTVPSRSTSQQSSVPPPSEVNKHNMQKLHGTKHRMAAYHLPLPIPTPIKHCPIQCIAVHSTRTKDISSAVTHNRRHYSESWLI